MQFKLAPLVSRRTEKFGGTVYVHSRNDFFFLDKPSYNLVCRLTSRWSTPPAALAPAFRKLAGMGICTALPTIPEEPFNYPAFIGDFQDIPKVDKPLVLNCFTTAHCPLRCRYCHADDLMQQYREMETEHDLDKVIQTARQIDAMIAVITGGDPLTKVDRAIRLIEGIAESKFMVLDTSGVAQKPTDLERIIPVLLKHRVHARVSLDEFADTNAKSRPINEKYITDGRLSYDHATDTIRTFLSCGIPVSVQTVLSRFNDDANNLFAFGTKLAEWGVKNWVVHAMTFAGKAGRERRALAPTSSLRAEADGLRTLRALYRKVRESKLQIDLRVTNSNSVEYAVFLVNSRGDLFTEGRANFGKTLIFRADEINRKIDIWKDVCAKAHTERYSNWIPGLYGESLSTLATRLHTVEPKQCA